MPDICFYQNFLHINYASVSAPQKFVIITFNQIFYKPLVQNLNNRALQKVRTNLIPSSQNILLCLCNLLYPQLKTLFTQHKSLALKQYIILLAVFLPALPSKAAVTLTMNPTTQIHAQTKLKRLFFITPTSNSCCCSSHSLLLGFVFFGLSNPGQCKITNYNKSQHWPTNNTFNALKSSNTFSTSALFTVFYFLQTEKGLMPGKNWCHYQMV